MAEPATFRANRWLRTCNLVLQALLVVTFTAGLNYVWAKDGSGVDEAKWQGLALYLKGQITPMFALAPRFAHPTSQCGVGQQRGDRLGERVAAIWQASN